MFKNDQTTIDLKALELLIESDRNILVADARLRNLGHSEGISEKTKKEIEEIREIIYDPMFYTQSVRYIRSVLRYAVDKALEEEK